MTIAKDFASKFAVAFVAIAMIFMAIAPAVQAAETTEDLQKMINDLLAQVATLQSQLGDDAAPAAGKACGVFTMDLKTGSTGAEVKALQEFLNSDADTQVAASGVGSKGMETMTYGPMTAAAVSKFQVKYRAEILSPAGLVNPTGFFGPGSRAQANKLCAGAPADEDEDEDMDEDEEDSELSGEADLDNFELNDGEESDLEEGEEDVSIGEISVEFADGDASISRIDLTLAPGSNDGDDDAYDVFDTVSLWVDGEMVAEMDASDEAEYLDEDTGEIRFSGLDIVGMEDEEVVITVGITTQESVDNVPEPWTLTADSIRFFDADGVASTEDSDDDSETVEFDIVEAGDGDDLDLESSEEDPESTTLALDEDDNVEHAIFAFDLSAEDSDGDIELSDMISIDVTVATTAASVGDDLDNLVSDFRLEIGGESFAAESYTGTGLTAQVDFDIDGDVTISAEETVTAVLYADFEDMDDVDQGSTIYATVATADIDAEGVDSGEAVTVDGSTKTGETHTLRTTGLVFGDAPTDGTDSSDSVQETSQVAVDDNYGTMFLEFEVTAFGDDLWVEADDAALGVAANEGLRYQILKAGVATATDIAVDITYDIEGADENNGYFELEEGETYTVTVTVESLNPEVDGLYSFRVNSLGYNDTEDTAADSYTVPSDVTEYVSDEVSIQS